MSALRIYTSIARTVMCGLVSVTIYGCANEVVANEGVTTAVTSSALRESYNLAYIDVRQGERDSTTRIGDDRWIVMMSTTRNDDGLGGVAMTLYGGREDIRLHAVDVHYQCHTGDPDDAYSFSTVFGSVNHPCCGNYHFRGFYCPDYAPEIRSADAEFEWW